MSDEHTMEPRRPRGRPPKEANQFKVAHAQASSDPVQALERIESAPSPEIGGRRRGARNVFGQHRQKLSYDARPGYHRHWFNDTGSRIGDAENGGYTKVNDKEGKPVSKIVGTQEGGERLVAYLMEIPQEWYDEDMAEQQASIDAKEELIKRRGRLEENSDDRGYVPQRPDGSSSISIRRGG